MNAKDGVQEHIRRSEAALIDLSHRIHGHPELGFEEERAVGWLADSLDAQGFRVERGICDLPTAFMARAGSGPLEIAICAEYDCLPDIGHACGHNLIAAIAVGAAASLARVADDVGLTIRIIGTPAEEGGGGKILMLERGAFDGVHAAMMVHPAPLDMAEPPIIAFTEFDVHYTGKASHASAAPERGINAADALTVAQTAIGLLRQHICPTDRIHGIVTRGGEAPNVIPARTSGRWVVRASSVNDLADVRAKVMRCFEAGAVATGCTMEVQDTGAPYAEMLHDGAMAALYQRNAEALGRYFPDLGRSIERLAASTDMGNVSQVIPSIHPMIGIASLPAVNHQPEFAAHCATPPADKAVLDGATALAWTAIDLASDDTLSARLRARTA
ncbi:MAG TPA: M20 family metallopeptidase [Candidatus Binatia bacterium]|jgi:amidohydrolase|nr:M20 family metallopeptidase [Candidatus Binatia bacterium]